jgi:hypothetical protein
VREEHVQKGLGVNGKNNSLATVASFRMHK